MNKQLRDMLALDAVLLVVAIGGLASGGFILSQVHAAIRDSHQASLAFTPAESCAIALSFMLGALPFVVSAIKTLRIAR